MSTWSQGDPRGDRLPRRLTPPDPSGYAASSRIIVMSVYGYPSGGSFTVPVTIKRTRDGVEEEQTKDVEIFITHSTQFVKQSFVDAFAIDEEGEESEEGEEAPTPFLTADQIVVTSPGSQLRNYDYLISFKAGVSLKNVTFGEVDQDNLQAGLVPYVSIRVCHA